MKFLYLFSLFSASKATSDFFWHLTDIHYDPWYTAERGISCNEQVPHRGPYGDFECDAPWTLTESAIKGMRNAATSDAKFLLWSGDNPPHVYNKSLNSMVGTDLIIDITQNITNVIREHFPGIPVLPMVGNHDYYPKNQLPGTTNPLYDALADMWGDWLDSEMQQTFRQGGFYRYVVSTTPSVWALTLNTNLYYHTNNATQGETDPAGQMAWYESQLSSARSQGAKIFLFSHVPFGKVPEPVDGVKWLRDTWNSYFTQKIIEYNDVILSTYAVHSHTDTFRVFYDSSNTPVSTMFLSPSVTPWRVLLSNGEKTPPHNPGFRRFWFDQTTYELTDYDQYSLDLKRANEGSVQWRLLYTFRQLHGVQSLTPANLNALLDTFRPWASDAFHRYYDAVYLNTVNDDYTPCDCECKSSHLCAIEFVDYVAYDECYAKRPACVACVLGNFGLFAIMLVASLVIKVTN